MDGSGFSWDTQPSGRSRRILVADHNVGAASVVVEVLEAGGFDVIGPVYDLAEAWSRSNNESIDGAILEMNLAGSFTFELAWALKQSGKPVIFFSRYGAHMLPFELRSTLLLSKPTGISSLGEAASATFS